MVTSWSQNKGNNGHLVVPGWITLWGGGSFCGGNGSLRGHFFNGHFVGGESSLHGHFVGGNGGSFSGVNGHFVGVMVDEC